MQYVTPYNLRSKFTNKRIPVGVVFVFFNDNPQWYRPIYEITSRISVFWECYGIDYSNGSQKVLEYYKKYSKQIGNGNHINLIFGYNEAVLEIIKGIKAISNDYITCIPSILPTVGLGSLSMNNIPVYNIIHKISNEHFIFKFPGYSMDDKTRLTLFTVKFLLILNDGVSSESINNLLSYIKGLSVGTPQVEVQYYPLLGTNGNNNIKQHFSDLCDKNNVHYTITDHSDKSIQLPFNSDYPIFIPLALLDRVSNINDDNKKRITVYDIYNMGENFQTCKMDIVTDSSLTNNLNKVYNKGLLGYFDGQAVWEYNFNRTAIAIIHDYFLARQKAL